MENLVGIMIPEGSLLCGHQVPALQYCVQADLSHDGQQEKIGAEGGVFGSPGEGTRTHSASASLSHTRSGTAGL